MVFAHPSHSPATVRSRARSLERRCIATGAGGDKGELLRFVVGPDGGVVPDLEGRLPGRGLWLVADRRAIETARRRNLFARAARRPVSAPDDLAERVRTLLRRRCLERLGLARRSGDLVLGFENVSARLAARGGLLAGALLFAASDGSLDGRRKLAGLRGDATVVDVFTGAELGRALGREHLVHVLVTPGRQAAALAAELRRLAGVESRSRDGDSDGAPATCGPSS